MKEILLTKEKRALIDEDDFEMINKWKWYYTTDGYARRKQWDKEQKKYKTIFMHRIINQTPDGLFTDHRDGNKLNNLRSNLRTCTISQNSANCGRFINNTSGFKGISWHEASKKWRASIQVRNKQKHIGVFLDIQKAIEAYDREARKQQGEFARTNT